MKRYPSDIMATCCVPWSESWEFEEGLFRDHVRLMVTQGTKHLYIFGTAGEGYAVTDAMFDRVVDVFADEMRAGNAVPMVGVISMSLPTIIERIQRCRDKGITRFQISLPSWGALTDGEMYEFFRQVCGRFRDCQFLHYNLMRTKRLVTPTEYSRLAEEHPNLVATKNSTDDMGRIEGLMEKAPQLQHFFGETGFVFGSQLGECGLLISLAATNWKMGRKFFNAAQQRDLATAIPMLRQISEMAAGLFASVQGPHIDGAFDKVLFKPYDSRFPLRMLPPYQYTSEAQYQAFVKFMETKLPQWLPGQ